MGEGSVFISVNEHPAFGAFIIWKSVIYALAKSAMLWRFYLRIALTLNPRHTRLRIHPLPLNNNITHDIPFVHRVYFYGGRGWIRTTEVTDNRFTVCPLWPLGNSPIFDWSWWTDSNPRPADYKSAALPTELHQHFNRHLFSCSNIIS